MRLIVPYGTGGVSDIMGRVVAQNRPAYRMFITPSRLRGPEDLAALYDLLGLDARRRAELEAQIAKVPESRRTHQIQVLGELTREQLAALETHARELPAVDVLSIPVRDYPYGKLAAHAIGYLNESGGIGYSAGIGLPLGGDGPVLRAGVSLKLN